NASTISVPGINAEAMGNSPTVYGTLKVTGINAGVMGNMPALSQTTAHVSTRRRGRVVMIT
ncbi:hypothetical protein, partial [Enterococcus faecium]|uniref:hypothetical protein n=1 Tax=Enterococcus faecium TaxID=1352 RepID=UPI0034E95EFF